MMENAVEVATVEVRADYREDGVVVLENVIGLDETSETIPARLAHWARERPNQLFLSEGDRELSYGEAEEARRELASRLIGSGIPIGQPIMIVGQNGINHALLMLAAASVGIPTAIVSPSYVAQAAAPWGKFAQIYRQIMPSLVIADDDPGMVAIIDNCGFEAASVKPLRDLAWAEDAPSVTPDRLVDAERAVGPDTITKLLFTSGSTGQPKAVSNTQRMMTSNMQALSKIWPFLLDEAPISVDWLPWSHTFGGNCCFNATLWFGGHSHIDEGRPTAAMIGPTLTAIRRWRPNIYYNVPVGFEALLPALEQDAGFAKAFLEPLRFVFNGGAPLPATLRSRIEDVSSQVLGKVPLFVAGWGSTETAPFSTILYFRQPYANNLGVPLPGTSIKMVPYSDRYELRVRGPNVMPGYWRDPVATASAFDEEGFYKIGDAGTFATIGKPADGILFGGRVAENFKLTSGTWVNVGALRLALISAGEKLISDVVVTGEGRREIGAIIFPNREACLALLGRAVEPEGGINGMPEVVDRLASLIDAYNAKQLGSSTRVACFRVVDEAPSLADGEITDKGYINQRRVLERRAHLVDELHDGG